MSLAREGKGVGERVSVIIPAYNVARFLNETLKSLFLQTVQPYEVIVVNDGSPDTPELEAVLKPYGDRIHYLRQENRGLSGARNTGIRAATGDFIALLDGDDLWRPDYIEQQSSFLREHPEYDVVYCNALFFGESIYAGQEYMTVCPSVGEVDASALISRRCHVFVSVMARARVLQQVGFDEALRSSEDFDCWLRMVAAGYKIGYHRKVLVQYRKHRASLSADPTWMAESNLKVLRKASSLWPKDSVEGSLLDEATQRKSAELAAICGKLALRAQDVSGAITHFEQANEFYKSSKLRGVIALAKYAPAPLRWVFTLRERFVRSYRGSN